MFFGGRTTLGQRTFALQRQSDSTDPETTEYRENVRWSRGGVIFLTLHIVGSNNNRGRTPSGDQEYARRTIANIKWLREGFRHASETNARAVMILTQANIFFENTPIPGGKEAEPSGFGEIRAAVEDVTTAFGKPVMFVHGDTHYFRMDKPLGRGTPLKRTPSLENFTRLETFGQPNHHWVQITVEPDDPAIFTVRQRIVPANVFTGRAASQR